MPVVPRPPKVLNTRSPSSGPLEIRGFSGQMERGIGARNQTAMVRRPQIERVPRSDVFCVRLSTAVSPAQPHLCQIRDFRSRVAHVNRRDFASMQPLSSDSLR